MNFLNRLFTLWSILVFSVFMMLLLPGILIPLILGNRFSWIGYKFLFLWSWIFSMLTFIRFDFQGRENIIRGKSYIYVSNHTSFLDIPGICLMLRSEFRPIAKKELLKIPVFGFIVKAATIVVDRGSHESRKKSIDAAKEILALGISMLIFAEGTQNRTNDPLQPLKDGAFRIAIDTQTPIVPLVVVGAKKCMPPGKLKLTPGRIKVIALKEIPVTGLSVKDTQELKIRTAEIMKSAIIQATA